jgi:glycosyltransferase involved in cell wall biosynthesis
MRALAIVQAWNRKDPIRGFTVRWMEKLAQHLDELIVLTLEQAEPPTHANMHLHSLGKEYTYGPGRRMRYLVRWHRQMREILRARPPDVVFTHMTPIFSVLAAPYAKARGIPVITWYAHRQVTWILKLAHHLSDRMVSIDETSYPYRHDKLVPLGHGIDTNLFSPGITLPETPPLLLSVGRLSPIKDPITLIEAVRLLRQRGHEVSCILVGEAPVRNRAYGEHVRQRVRALGLDDVVQLPGAVSNDQVVHWYRRCFAHVNCSPADHSLDKTALEAMACGRLSLSSALGFRQTMGPWADCLLFRHGDAADLADKLTTLLALSRREVEQIGLDLCQRIVQMHNLCGLAERLVKVFAQVRE